MTHGFDTVALQLYAWPWELYPFFTTKSTKSTKKKSENETFDAIFQFCHVEVHQ